MNTNSKSALKSKTIWGSILAAAPTVLSLLTDTATMSLFGIPAGTIAKVATLAGAAIAVHGRLTATQPVHVVSPQS